MKLPRTKPKAASGSPTPDEVATQLIEGLEHQRAALDEIVERLNTITGTIQQINTTKGHC